MKKYHQIALQFLKKHEEICLRNGPFTTNLGIVKLHTNEETHWVAHMFGQKVGNLLCGKKLYCYGGPSP